MTDNVLEIRELSKDYGDFVLDRVSFALPRGVIMGLTRINRKSLFYIFPLCVTLKKKGVFHYVTYG